MQTVEKNLLRASYMNEFSCIGAECEDTCCVGWSVVVDRPTYENYQTFQDPALKAMFLEHLIPLDPNQTPDFHVTGTAQVEAAPEQRYAMIRWLDGQRCPMLDRDSLCMIQKKAGESALSTVCSNFPREYNLVTEQLEMSANLSCPEIARLALLNPNGIDFEYAPISFDERLHYPKRRIDTAQTAVNEFNSNDPKSHFWSIRIFCIEVIQDRRFRLNDRILFLGTFFEQLQQFIDDLQIEQIPAQIDKYRAKWKTTQPIDKKTYPLQVDDVQISDHQLQLEFLKSMIQRRVQKGWISERFVECYAAFICGIGDVAEANQEDVLARYRSADAYFSSHFSPEYEYIFENYLVNNIFKQLFPFGQAGRVWDEFLLLVVHYAQLCQIAKGMFAYEGNVHIGALLQLIQSYSKTIEHHKVFVPESLDWIKSTYPADLKWLQRLISISSET